MLRVASRQFDPVGVLTRRRWLAAGLLGCAGVLRAGGAGGGPGFGRAKSVVVLFAGGGVSQLETWDPKPDAPEEVRGAFGSVQTAVPGLRVGEHLPRLAALARSYHVVRTLTHDDLDHGSAVYLALTGRFHPRKSSNPPPRPDDAPSAGSILRRARPRSPFPFTAAHLNGPLLAPQEPAPGQGGGFLGRGFGPLVVGDVSSEPVLLRGLSPLPDLPAGRLHARRELLAALERGPADDPLRRQAHDLLDDPLCRDVFALDREPAAVRDRYGRHRTGQACLLARRLVEAGLPLITVFLNHNIRGQDDSAEEDEFGWDTHNDIFVAMRERLMPRLDQSVSAFLEDLAQRGLLGQTLVVLHTEFGRAPRVAKERTFAGTLPGRKHWAGAYSSLLAGAGVAGGGVYGSTDRHAAYPQDRPCGPADITATVFAALGLDPAGHFEDAAGRPFPLSEGRPLAGLYG